MQKNRFSILSVVLAVLLSISAVNAAPRYNVIDLGALGGKESAAYRINNNGQVIGSAQTANGFYHSVLWSNGNITDLTPLIEVDPNKWMDKELYTLNVMNINEAGMTAGTKKMEDGVMQAFIWNDTGLYSFGNLGGDSIAWDLNNSQQVVGTVDTQEGRKSFLWEKGKITQIGDVNTFAMAVNSLGQVTGNTFITRPHPTIPDIFESGTYAFIWDNGEMKDLGALAGAASAGMDINDLGQVVGISVVMKNNNPGPLHAALWDDGEIVDLGVLFEGNDEWSAASAINNHYQIVGASVRDWILVDRDSGAKQGVNCGFLWEEDELYNLNDLINQPGRWDIQTPLDINDNGIIVGVGRYTENGLVWIPNRAFMLVPIGGSVEEPEPTQHNFYIKPMQED